MIKLPEIELTKSAKKSIAIIYKEYKRRIKSGERKTDAMRFEIDNYPDMVKTVANDRKELAQHGLLKLYNLYGFKLEDKAILFMENKTLDTIKEWLSFGTQLIP